MALKHLLDFLCCQLLLLTRNFNLAKLLTDWIQVVSNNLQLGLVRKLFHNLLELSNLFDRWFDILVLIQVLLLNFWL